MSTPAVSEIAKYKSAEEISQYIARHPLKMTADQLDLKSLWQDLADVFSQKKEMPRQDIATHVKTVIEAVIEEAGNEDQRTYVKNGPPEKEYMEEGVGVGRQYSVHVQFKGTFASCTRIMQDCADNRTYSPGISLEKRISLTKKPTA